MKIYLVVGWREYESDVVLAACKREAIAKEIVLAYKAADEDDDIPFFEGYDIKEMDVVE